VRPHRGRRAELVERITLMDELLFHGSAPMQCATDCILAHPESATVKTDDNLEHADLSHHRDGEALEVALAARGRACSSMEVLPCTVPQIAS
jgi:hypothetical protein